ncbi:MAG: TIGR03986 family CRISPR-associated RAMP protein [Saprospiraceae bacterium]
MPYLTKSPYNFIPYADKVIYPKWSEVAFQDIPFENGESGKIEITIKSEGLLFIRNGHSKHDAEIAKQFFQGKAIDKLKKEKAAKGESLKTSSDDEKHLDLFLNQSEENINSIKKYIYSCNHASKLFIPGSTIKGLVRNNIEIISQGKFKVNNEIQEMAYGLRDMNNNFYKNELINVKPSAGWLIKKGDDYLIKEAKFVGRINKRDIISTFSISKDYNTSSITKKLEILKHKNYTKFNFQFDRILSKWRNGRQREYGNLYKFSKAGEEGYVVPFGEIGGKHYDFIFGPPTDTEFTLSQELYQRNLDVFKSLDPKNDNWDIYRDYYKELGMIPVMFVGDADTQKVKHFGISQLYRLNNPKKVKYFCPTYDKKLDLAETIFGTTENAGRVNFSHCFSDRRIEHIEYPFEVTQKILNSPKPSYYPNYITQTKLNTNDNYTFLTYHDANSEKTKITLRGFKKYPIHISPKLIDSNPSSDKNEKIYTYFLPISDTIFKGKINFHNLTPIEIGALISALTFHGNKNLYHNIGSAKPYGFGKIKIEIDEIKWRPYLEIFKEYLNKNGISIEDNIQFKEWFAMGSLPSNDIDENLLQYPLIELLDENNRLQNEFNNYKKDKEALKPYSEYINRKKNK